jgi:diguanylate cyclase (GGDEF)-like protein
MESATLPRETNICGLNHLTMPKPSPALLPSEPDPAILERMIQVEHACLTVLVVVVATNIAGWLIPAFANLFPRSLQPMKAESVLAVMLSALSLILSEAGQSKWIRRLSILLAVAVCAVACVVLLKYKLDFLAGIDTPLPETLGSLRSGRMSEQSAMGFGLLSCTMVLASVRNQIAVRVADVLTFGLCLMVLTLVSGHIFGVLSFYGIATEVPTSPQTLFCLMLLANVVVLRRAENGVFSIFTGRGIGGRLARILSPIILVLPYLREGARARILGNSQMPTNYVTAVLASLAAMISLGLLLYLAWRINGMESEIHVLTLRDELTGLYNLRGFQLLAEQALRLAQRSGRPFSVLFIDLDNLKMANDSLGHSAGSKLLVETSEILQQTFRESDVLGRIGGDEFAVAGHFSEEAIEAATERLETCCAEKNAEDGRRYALSFSVGHVTSMNSDTNAETLNELLARADQAMYRVKRSKKDKKLQGKAEPAG